MSRRNILILISLFLCVISAAAQDGRLRIRGTAGTVYSQNFFKLWHFNYICNDGYRVDDSDKSWHLHANASFLAGVSLETGKRTALTLQSGYAGISDKSRVLPVLIGIARFKDATCADCYFCYASAGTGIHLEGMEHYGLAILATVGSGYRFCLCPEMAMDLKLGLNASYDRPPVKDVDGSGYVPGRNIRRSNAICCALEFGVTFSF